MDVLEDRFHFVNVVLVWFRREDPPLCSVVLYAVVALHNKVNVCIAKTKRSFETSLAFTGARQTADLLLTDSAIDLAALLWLAALCGKAFESRVSLSHSLLKSACRPGP